MEIPDPNDAMAAGRDVAIALGCGHTVTALRGGQRRAVMQMIAASIVAVHHQN